MDPLTLSIIMSFAPALLSGLMGDPQKRLRSQLNKVAGPGNLSYLTNQNYQNFLSGPAYQQGLASIAAGANQAQNRIGAELGARGIGTSGTGAILSGLTPSLVGSQRGQLQTAGWQSAQQQAQQQVQNQIQALMGTSGPSQTQQMFAGGLEAFAPLLLEWLKRNQAGGVGGQFVKAGWV